MDFKTQTNHQPQQTQGTAPARGTGGTSGPSGGSRTVLALAIGLVVALVVAIGVFLLAQGMNKSGSGDSAVETDKYQAVFMSNGQVYFGRLSKVDTGYAQLTDVYYLQVQQAVQPAADKKETDEPKVSLTKLGNELHGPTDKMHISRDQILFWENLKDDSTVVEAIKKHRDN